MGVGRAAALGAVYGLSLAAWPTSHYCGWLIFLLLGETTTQMLATGALVAASLGSKLRGRLDERAEWTV